MQKIVIEWRDEGIVRDTSSPYASPVILVKKKSGEWRLVVDFRKLNAQTERVNFPLPNIDEFLEVLNQEKLFETLDFAHGYLQLPLKEEARHKTAFVTPDETCEFTRAIFGLTNAPFYFSKAMELALGPLRNRILVFYLDDILIVAEDWRELLARTRVTLESLESAGLTIKLEKCKFGVNRVEFSGFVISKRGIEPGTPKVIAITKFPVPQNIHELRRFLGLTGFFRRFVQGFATIAATLTALTLEDAPFVWGEAQSRAFEKLKGMLASTPILGVYSPKAARTELHCDASKDTHDRR